MDFLDTLCALSFLWPCTQWAQLHGTSKTFESLYHAMIKTLEYSKRDILHLHTLINYLWKSITQDVTLFHSVHQFVSSAVI